MSLFARSRFLWFIAKRTPRNTVPDYSKVKNQSCYINDHYKFNAISTSARLFSCKPAASFEDVKKATTSNNVLIIDVREPSELQETGVIPNSINIPLGKVEEVLKNTSEKEFLQSFGKNKPNKNDPIIFSCKLGKRSGEAQDIASKLGFSNVKNYEGGWQDWEKH